jgi:hypothetical protein
MLGKWVVMEGGWNWFRAGLNEGSDISDVEPSVFTTAELV